LEDRREGNIDGFASLDPSYTWQEKLEPPPDPDILHYVQDDRCVPLRGNDIYHFGLSASVW
jgi:hypothetical protein